MEPATTLQAQATNSGAGTALNPSTGFALHPFWDNPLFHKFLLLLVIGAVIVAAMTFAIRYTNSHIATADQRRRVRKLITLAGICAIALVAAFTFSNSLASLTVSLGVAGAAVAFALQQVLASGVAWLQISAGKVYSVGDRVKMGGVVGDVIHINVFLTTLMEIGGDWVKGDQYSGRVVRVPNSAIYQQPIFNYSADYDYVWDELKVTIRYGSDRTKAVKIMEEAVTSLTREATEAMRVRWEALKEDFDIEDAKLEPAVFLVANDNWLEYSIRYLVHYKARRSTKSELCERIVLEIEKNSDTVSIASGTYDIVGLPPVTVNLNGGDKLPAAA